MHRLINFGLLITFLICYTNWGHNEVGFIAQIEFDIFKYSAAVTAAIQNPLLVLAFPGEILLFVGIFQSSNTKRLTLAGLILVGIPVLDILVTGVLNGEPLSSLSTIPFLAIAILWFVRQRKLKEED
jgi:hypothetical protein